jgi:hypothetical protein
LYTGGVFDSVSWNSDETKVLYSAEIQAEESSCYLDDPSAKNFGRKYDFKANWGEELSKSSKPSLFILDIPSQAILSPLQVSRTI